MSLPVRLSAFALALHSAACANPRQETSPPVSDPILETIDRLVVKLDSDLIEERNTAALKLVELGAPAVPTLVRRASNSPSHVKTALLEVIRRIHYTDPLIMVRPSIVRITADVQNATMFEAYEALFRDLPLRPELSAMLRHPGGQDERRKRRGTFKFAGESYWNAVSAFSKTYQVVVDTSDFGRGEFEEGGSSVRWSRAKGPCIVSATLEDGSDDSSVTIRMHLEPGIQPIEGAFTKVQVRGQDGAIRDVKQKPEPWGDRHTVFTGDRRVPTAGELRIACKSKDYPEIVSVLGVARVVLPTKVESVSWDLRTWKDEPVRELAGCRITLKEFDEDSIALASSSNGKGEKESRPEFANGAWIILSDNAGRTSNNQAIGVLGSGAGHSEMSVSSGWPHETPVRSLYVIRPLEAEVLEFPFEIEQIPLPRKR